MIGGVNCTSGAPPIPLIIVMMMMIWIGTIIMIIMIIMWIETVDITLMSMLSEIFTSGAVNLLQMIDNFFDADDEYENLTTVVTWTFCGHLCCWV